MGFLNCFLTLHFPFGFECGGGGSGCAGCGSGSTYLTAFGLYLGTYAGLNLGNCPCGGFLLLPQRLIASAPNYVTKRKN